VATFCSTSFAPLGAIVAEALGQPDLPIGALKHPLAGLSPSDIVERVRPVVEDAFGMLTLPVAERVRRYSGRRWVEARAKVKLEAEVGR
jgi:hypothetical protein